MEFPIESNYDQRSDARWPIARHDDNRLSVTFTLERARVCRVIPAAGTSCVFCKGKEQYRMVRQKLTPGQLITLKIDLSL